MVYFCIFQRTMVLKMLDPTMEVRDPTYDSVLWQVAGLFAMIAVNQAVLLRYTDDIGVWKISNFGVLLVDIFMVGGILEMLMTQERLSMKSMLSEDWTNVVFTLIVIVIRVLFILGVGVKGTLVSKLEKTSCVPIILFLLKCPINKRSNIESSLVLKNFRCYAQ